MSDNVITRFNYYCYSQVYKGRVQKKRKIVENSTKGVGISDGRFSTMEKNMGLKHWILHNNHLKTHLFF